MGAAKLCTIVGMGPGLSRGIARRFAQAGFSIAMVGRDGPRLSELQRELGGTGHPVASFTADAGDEDALRSVLRRTHAELGPTEVLVYNAASLRPGQPSTMGPDDLIHDLRVNVVGALVAAQEVLPAMKRAGKGTILLTGGGLALEPHPWYASLSIGKAGIRSLAFCLAAELEPAGIHVATVTICGLIQPGTRFAPDKIAEAFFRLHQQARGAWEREIIYQ